MNKLLIVALLLLSEALQAQEMTQRLLHIDTMIKEISDAKKRFNARKLSKIPDPVHRPQVAHATTESTPGVGAPAAYDDYQLFAVLGERAKINDRWLRVGERIGEYRLSALNTQGATLTSPQRTLHLEIGMANSRVFVRHTTIQ